MTSATTNSATHANVAETTITAAATSLHVTV